MSKSILARFRKDVPTCCSKSVLLFAAGDLYQGAGEPGDTIRCSECGNWLVYGVHGAWRVRAATAPQESER